MIQHVIDKSSITMTSDDTLFEFWLDGKDVMCRAINE